MTIRFTCTSLQGTSKKGMLPVDENGYREVPVGGLNIFNSAGQYYTYQGAKELFENSSQFMRRVKRGALRGEVGHPTKRRDETMDDFIGRYISIDENNICAHFAEIFLDFENFKDATGKQIIAIMAKVKGSGVKGDFLEKQFANNQENVCFSVRAFTDDYSDRGVIKRDLKNIITFDYVNEPGIKIATKYDSPALESLLDKPVSKDQLVRAFNTRTSGMATESNSLSTEELFQSFNWTLPVNEKPVFSKW